MDNQAARILLSGQFHGLLDILSLAQVMLRNRAAHAAQGDVKSHDQKSGISVNN